MAVQLASTQQASAQTCPDPSLFTTAVANSIDPIELPTYDTMPALDGAACSDVITPTWCASSFGYPPYTGSTVRDKLFLWLVGRGNIPEQTHFIPTTAAYAGYHVVNLAYDNEREIGDWCTADGLEACDQECHFTMAQEMISGVDDPLTSYPGDPMHSVDGRLRLAIEDLHDMDVNDDGVNDDGWDAYCVDNDPLSPGPDLQWHLIETGGFSQGAQITAYISYLEPGTEPGMGTNTIGHFAVDGGVPVCGPVLSGSPSDDYFPNEMTKHAMFPPCGELAECPKADRFLAMRDLGLVDSLFAYVDTALAEMNFDTTFYDIDADVTNGTVDLSNGNLLRTFQSPATPAAYHNCVAIDSDMPADTSGTDSFGDPSAYFLMPLYLDVLCEIDQ